MYAPSFITGSLISRLGIRTMMAAGLVLILAAAAVSLMGIAIWNFWLGLILLGVGWNFAFISATTLVADCHSPHERNKVQAFNDFLMFGAMAISSFSSGALLAHFGWAAVNEMVFPAILVTMVLVAWGFLGRRPTPA
jgi:MFS family permease